MQSGLEDHSVSKLLKRQGEKLLWHGYDMECGFQPSWLMLPHWVWTGTSLIVTTTRDKRQPTGDLKTISGQRSYHDGKYTRTIWTTDTYMYHHLSFWTIHNQYHATLPNKDCAPRKHVNYNGEHVNGNLIKFKNIRFSFIWCTECVNYLDKDLYFCTLWAWSKWSNWCNKGWKRLAVLYT